MKIKLVPVIEFEPWTFPKESRELPPYEEGSWFVRVSDIKGQALDTLIQKHLEKAMDDETDYALSFSGGVVLEVETHKFPPQCCGSMEDIANWDRVSKSEKLHEDPLLWVGHPWLLASCKSNDIIEISETTELLTDVELQIVSLNKHLLQAEILRVRSELEIFQALICKRLQAAKTNNPNKLAARLLGLDAWP